MVIRRGGSGFVGAGAVVALALVLSGCSDDGDSGSGEFGQPVAETTEEGSGAPQATTIDLTVDGQTVDLGDATLKCYDFEGHLMVEAHNAADSDASHFLMDDYQDSVSLSIGVQDGLSGVFEYDQGNGGLNAEATRKDHSVTVTGTIEESDTAEPVEFSIEASCAEFVETPPDSSKVGEGDSDLTSIPSTCPPGEVVCIPGGE